MSKKNTRKLIQELLDKLDDQIEKVKESPEFEKILDFYSQFHNYSYRNILLIKSQCPKVSLVKGYKQWKELDRYVMPREEREKKEGVKADPIRILVPNFYYKDQKVIQNQNELEEARQKVNQYKTYRIKEKEGKKVLQQKKIYFSYANIYDISQTEGKPIPKLDLDLKNNFATLKKILIDYCNKNDLDVKFKSFADQREGYQRKNKIVINQDKNETTQGSILIHEIAHFHLHNGNSKINKELTELEAESVAYVVLKHFNIENTSARYLAFYKKNRDLKDSLNRIHQTATGIIAYCEEWLANCNSASIEMIG